MRLSAVMLEVDRKELGRRYFETDFRKLKMEDKNNDNKKVGYSIRGRHFPFLTSSVITV